MERSHTKEGTPSGHEQRSSMTPGDAFNVPRARTLSQDPGATEKQLRARLAEAETMIDAFMTAMDPHESKGRNVPTSKVVSEFRQSLPENAADVSTAVRLQSSLAENRVVSDFHERTISNLKEQLRARDDEINRLRTTLVEAQENAVAGSSASPSSAATAQLAAQVRMHQAEIGTLKSDSKAATVDYLSVKSRLKEQVIQQTNALCDARNSLSKANAFWKWRMATAEQKAEKTVSKLASQSFQKNSMYHWRIAAADNEAERRRTEAAQASAHAAGVPASKPKATANVGVNAAEKASSAMAAAQTSPRGSTGSIPGHQQRPNSNGEEELLRVTQALDHELQEVRARAAEVEQISSKLKDFERRNQGLISQADFEQREAELIALITELREALATAAQRVEEVEGASVAREAELEQQLESEREQHADAILEVEEAAKKRVLQAQVDFLEQASQKWQQEKKDLELLAEQANNDKAAAQTQAEETIAANNKRNEEALIEAETRAAEDREKQARHFDALLAESSQAFEQQKEDLIRQIEDLQRKLQAADDREAAAIGRWMMTKEKDSRILASVKQLFISAASEVDWDVVLDLEGMPNPIDETDIDKLVSEIVALKVKADELPKVDHRLGEALSQVDNLGQELDVTRKSLTDAESSIAQLQTDVEEKAAEVRLQRKERYDTESQLFDALAQRDDSNNQVSTLSARVDELSRTVEDLQKQLQASQEQAADLQDRLNAAESQMATLSLDLERSKQYGDQTKAELEKEKGKYNRMRESLLEAEQDERTAAQKAVNSQIRITELEKELSDEVQKGQNFQSQLEKATSDLARAKELHENDSVEIMKLRSQISELEKKIEELNQRLKDEMGDREMLREALEGLKQDRESMKSSIHALSSEREQLRKSLNDSSQQHQEQLRTAISQRESQDPAIADIHKTLVEQSNLLRRLEGASADEQKRISNSLTQHAQALQALSGAVASRSSPNMQQPGNNNNADRLSDDDISISSWNDPTATPRGDLPPAEVAARAVRRLMRRLSTEQRSAFKSECPGVNPKQLNGGNIIQALPAWCNGMRAALESSTITYAT